MATEISAEEVCSSRGVEENCEPLLRSVITCMDCMWIDKVHLQGLSQFHTACANNCLVVIKTLLHQGQAQAIVNISVPKSHPEFAGYTGLHFAAANGNFDAVDLLLSHKADFNVQDVKGLTALHLAHYRKFGKIVERILSAYKDNFEVCPVDEQNLSHFHICCMDGPVEIVRGFVDARSVDVNAKVGESAASWPGCTALHIAAEYERPDIVEILLEAGANPNHVDGSGMTPLHFACRLSLLKADLAKASLNKRFGDQRVFELNSGKAQKSIVSLLLEHGANVNVQDSTGKTAILHLYDCPAFKILKEFTAPWFRRRYGNVSQRGVLRNYRNSTVNLLIKRGANVRAADDNGYTLLHYLAVSFQEDFNIEFVAGNLVNEGVDIDARTKSGKTPLFLACYHRMSWPLVIFLLENGADPNAAERSRNSTPFVNYILSSRSDVLTKFIDSGADFRHQLKNGKTVLHVLFSRKKDDGYSVTNSQLQRMIVQCLDEVPELLGVEGCIDVQDSFGRTALHYACLRNDAEDIKKLIDYGAAIDIEDKEGTTAFECCSNDRALIHATRYAMILKKAGVPFSKSCSELIARISSSYRKNEEDEVQEAREMACLRTITLDRYNTLYDLMFKRPSELVKHVKNPDVSLYLSPGDAPSVLPKFGGVLLYQYRKGLLRQKLSEPARKALTSLTNRSLPDCCWDQVLDYLNDTSVNNLIAGVPHWRPWLTEQ